MTTERVDRREFMRAIGGSAAVMSSLPLAAFGMGDEGREVSYAASQGGAEMAAKTPPRIRFAVIGINHYHIYSQVGAVLRGGGELVSVYAKEPDLVAAFVKSFPQAKVARSEDEILDDKSIQLVLSSIIPVERAPLGIRVMKRGKDYMADKPGITTLEQLAEVRRVQAETKRIYSIMYSERLENRATVKAGELVQAGAIGHVVQTIGLGPHRMNTKSRAPWFFDKQYYGGVLCDLASHQADQFLYFTGSTQGEVVVAQVGNIYHSQYPEFERFRRRGVAWEQRLRVHTSGLVYARRASDLGRRPIDHSGYGWLHRGPEECRYRRPAGGSHLFLVDQKQTQYIDTKDQDLPYGRQIVDDVLNRTETAMTQAHCFLATELMLKAQKGAQRLANRG